LAEDLGCERDRVLKILEIITGEKIPVPDPSEAWIRGALSVPTENPNQHNYEIGKPVMGMGNAEHMRITGNSGNNLCSGVSIRRPTEEEIAQFVADVDVKAAGECLKHTLAVVESMQPTL
jgi:hypothetical protein